MIKDREWIRKIGGEYYQTEAYVESEVLHNPRFDHLHLEVTGSLYEIEAGVLEESLAIYNHLLIGGKINPHELFTDQVAHIPNTLVIGMGLTGFTFAGFYDIGNDGIEIEQTANDLINDFDFLLVTETTSTNETKYHINNRIRELQKINVQDTTLHEVDWQESFWENGALKGRISYTKTYTSGHYGNIHTFTPIEFGHINRKTLQEAVDYALSYINPFKSNVVGAPLYLLISDEKGKLKHYIWQPVDFDTEAETHKIDLTDPENFASDIRCLKQIPRALHFAYLAQAAAKYYEPYNRLAKPSEKMMIIFTEAIEKYRNSLTPEIIASCIKRLETCIYRSDLIARNHQKSWHTEDHVFTDFPDAQEFFVQYLDQIGWGEAVLGKTVSEYLENKTH